MTCFGDIKLLYGNGNVPMVEEISTHLGIKPVAQELFKFKNDNIFFKINENIRGTDVFIIQSTNAPTSDRIMELLIMQDAAWRASAGRITVVLPYMSYTRTDKKDQPRVPITARLIADLIETAKAHRVLTMDLHADQIQGFFSIPVDHLRASPVIASYLRNKGLKGDSTVVVAPDAGGAKRARELARRLNCSIAIIDKRRSGNDDRAEVMNVVGEVEGKKAILFDDEIDTGGTMVKAAKALKEAGAVNVYAAATHGVFSADATLKLQNSVLEEVIVTNTIHQPPEKKFPKLTVLSVAKLFAEAIKRIHLNASVSALFE